MQAVLFHFVESATQLKELKGHLFVRTTRAQERGGTQHGNVNCVRHSKINKPSFTFPFTN